jgi:hypothetical protein
LQFSLEIDNVNDEGVFAIARQADLEVRPIQSSNLRCLSCKISPRLYQWVAAARRISHANSFGGSRIADSTASSSFLPIPSGTSS